MGEVVCFGNFFVYMGKKNLRQAARDSDGVEAETVRGWGLMVDDGPNLGGYGDVGGAVMVNKI